MTPRIGYRADITNNTIDEHKYCYRISEAPLKERYENHKISFRHRSHLTALHQYKYYWKLVENGAVPTFKFSIAKRVKVKLFINNCNLCLNEKAFIIRNLDDKHIKQKVRIYIKMPT